MGKSFTFYSYKGGVGRSMALANVAVQLAHWQYKTLIVDWDFEAPGLEYFFADYIDIGMAQSHPGMVDLLGDFVEEPQSSKGQANWSHLTTQVRVSSSHEVIDLITSGRRDDAYFSHVRALDIAEFYKLQGGHFIEKLRNEWNESYDFVLIDSRTGVTDIGGICTVQLPDTLVLLFTATDQSLEGVIRLAEKARRIRRSLPFDRSSLRCLPLASRIDAKEEFRTYQAWLRAAAPKLTPLMSNWLPDSVSTSDFVEAAKLPYIPFFSYGEKLAIVEQSTADRGGLGYAYESVAALIANDLRYASRFVRDRDSYVRAGAQGSYVDSPEEPAQRQPELTDVIAPIIAYVINVLDGPSEELSPADVHGGLQHQISAADDIFSGSEQRTWELARYALVVWADELLRNAPFTGKLWAKEPLEYEIHSSTDGAFRFYANALESIENRLSEATTVHYLLIMLGFRGCYDDDDQEGATSRYPTDFPDSLEKFAALLKGALHRQPGVVFDSLTRELGPSVPMRSGPNVFAASVVTVFTIAFLVITCALFAFS